MISANYDKSCFDVPDIASAKRIILTPEIGLSTDDRWERETPYLLKLMSKLDLTSESIVLDFGCGIGRLSKALIEKYGCQVIGVDISISMRALSDVYVYSPKFFSVSPESAELFKERVDAVISVWTLQHVGMLEKEIDRIKNVLKPGGKLFIVNERRRFIPTDKGWLDDAQDVFIHLQSKFNTEQIDMMNPDVVTEDVSKRTFYGFFNK